MSAHRTPARRARLRSLTAALAAVGALALAPTAVLAAPAAPDAPIVVAVEGTEEPGSEEGGRRPIAETPRDVLALVMLASLLGAAGIGLANARRQLRGERPEADGRFRWR